MEQLITIKPKKPIVVLKKGLIFNKVSSSGLTTVLNTTLKRPIALISATQNDQNAKKKCVTVTNPAQCVASTNIINQIKIEETEGTTDNAPTNIICSQSLDNMPVLISNSTPKGDQKQLSTNSTPKDDLKQLSSSTSSNQYPLPKQLARQMAMQLIKCQSHQDFVEHKDEDLIKVGDTFNSLQEFEEHTNKHAQKWFFYYVRIESKNLKTHSNYKRNLSSFAHYYCRFHKTHYKCLSKGIRKRPSELLGLECPAVVVLKCPAGKDVFIVQRVCHHHCHELSEKLFNSTPHGHRLPQEIKDEIRDLALFNVDPVIARRYIESKLPGLPLKKTVYNLFQHAKRKSTKNDMSPERVEEMLAKIKHIKANYSCTPPPLRSRNLQKDQEIVSSSKVIVISQEEAESDSLTTKDEQMFEQESTQEADPWDEPIHDVGSDTIIEYDQIDDYKEKSAPATGVKTKKQSNRAVKTESFIVSKNELIPVETKCQKRHVKFPEHKADGLVKVGDTFSSMEEFARYAAAHALEWYFYYQVHDSRNVKTTDKYNSKRKTWYNLTCRFNKGWYKSTSTGARKIKRKTTKCPAMVGMVCNPGEDRFKVIYVCHHHSHELSHDVFSQEAHGHRLAPELKEEIRELAWFQLDRKLMRQYLQQKTGFNLKATIKNVLAKMKQDGQKLHFSPEKEQEILDKIKEIKQNFSIPKRASPKKKNQTNYYEEASDSEDEEGESRLEARLNNILYDEELIQSVKDLQASSGCEIRIVPWEDVDLAEEQGVTHLQAGIAEETEQIIDDYNQIEIDQEQYIMDEHVDYIVPSDDNAAIFEITTQQCEDNQPQNLEPQEVNEVNDNDYQTIYQYTTDDESHIKNESEPAAYTDEYSEENYNSRDVGVQADLEIIELERYCEKIQSLEWDALNEDIKRSKVNTSTRGRPKIVSDEAIINRYNIEFYLNVGGIIPCIEQLAASTKVSVLDLLNKLYQGDAVFKMTSGRSPKNDRKSVQLTYVPLTITFPYEKFKYINGLQEYKNICAKYSDATIQLENTIESMSTELKDAKEKLKVLETQKQEFVKVMKNYESLVKEHAANQELLKENKVALKKSKNENKVLLNKIKQLEILKATSQVNDYALTQELLKNNQEHINDNKVFLMYVNNPQSSEDSQPLDEDTTELLLECGDSIKTEVDTSIQHENSEVLDKMSNIDLIEKINKLEEAARESGATIKNYKNKIRQIEELYLSDSQSLLDKIASLENERSTSDNMNQSTDKPTIQSYETEDKHQPKKINKKNKSQENKIKTEML